MSKVLKNLGYSFRHMNLREHLIYWIAPILICWLLAFMYFAGTPWMQAVVAHPYNRELGLLEHLENAFLLIIIILVIVLLRRAKGTMLTTFFILCLGGFVFLFLEEIDYGFHYINYYKGIRPGEDTIVRNLHNREKGTISKMMWVCYAAILFIMVLPHIYKDRLAPWVRTLVPSLRLQFTILAIPLVSKFPFYLDSLDFTPNGALHRNLSEFEEIMIYYIFFLYFYELTIKKKYEVRSTKYDIPKD
jgi:hypothetical protein